MSSIADLLATEKSRPGFTPEAKAAMWAGVEKSIAGAVVAGAAGATATAAATKVASWKIAALASAALVVGAGAGAAAHATFAEPKTKTKTVVVERTVEVKVAAPVVSVAPTQETVVAPIASSHPLATAKASSAPPAKDPSLARERNLLDMARTALSRGDTSSALSAIDTHAKEFPKSQLAQEREVLAIQALAGAGRMPEARQRAASFRAAYPKSPLVSIVDEATQ